MKTRAEAFNDWLKTSLPGQVFTYYTGHLAVDRGSYIYDPTAGLEFVPNETIDKLGWLALSAWEANRVYLFQRKLHDHVWEYIAMKRRDAGRLW